MREYGGNSVLNAARCAGSVLLLLGVLWCALAYAEDDALVACRAHEHDDTGAGVQACTRALAGADDPLIRFEVLARLSDLHVLRGEFVDAQVRLDEAAAVVLPQSAWEADYRLQRRRGLLAFRQHQLGAAMPWFLSAARLAARHGNVRFQAISANDESLVLRQIGDLAGALDALMRSLALQRQTPEPDLAPVLNNIGDLYREQEAWAEADQHYAEAEALYAAAGRRVDVAHTQERRALVAARRGDRAGAERSLAAAYTALAAEGAHALAQSVLASRLEIALDAGDLTGSTARAAELMAYTQAPPSAPASLLLARAERLAGRLEAAGRWLEQADQLIDRDDASRLDLIHERALLADAQGRADLAARHYADALALQQAQHRQRAADSLAVLRVRYELSEKERQLAELAATDARSQLQLQQLSSERQWLQAGVILALGGLLGLAWYGRQRRRRQHLDAAQALRESRAHYRELEQRLHLQSARQLQLLQVMQRPALLVDDAGAILAANAGATAAMGHDLGGMTLSACAISGDPASIERLARPEELAGEADVCVRWREDPQRSWRLQVHALAGDACALVVLLPAADESAGSAVSAPFWSREPQRRALVDLMRLSLALFEAATGKTRIDLAERSRIWRVTVDDGRLRVRALERYLSLARLPQQPRWREVLRTAYYVLSECDLDPARRAELAGKADALRAQIDAHGGGLDDVDESIEPA